MEHMEIAPLFQNLLSVLFWFVAAQTLSFFWCPTHVRTNPGPLDRFLNPIKPNKTNSRYMYHNINKLYSMHQTNPNISNYIWLYMYHIWCRRGFWLKKQITPDDKFGSHLSLRPGPQLLETFRELWKTAKSDGPQRPAALRKGQSPDLIAVIQKIRIQLWIPWQNSTFNQL